MVKKLVRAFNWFHIGLVQFAKLLLVLMISIIFINVVLRYGFNSGLQWSEEIALVIAIWFTFISLTVGVKQHLHIHINILPVGHIPKKLDSFLLTLRSVVVIVVGFVFVIAGISLVSWTMRSILPATKIPTGFRYLVIPISGLLLIYEGLTDILKIDTHDEMVNTYLNGEISGLEECE